MYLKITILLSCLVWTLNCKTGDKKQFPEELSQNAMFAQAVQAGDAERSRLALAAGASVYTVIEKNQYGHPRNAMDIALSTENLQLLEVIINAGYDVNTKDNLGRNAIIFVKNLEQMKILVDAGIDVNNQSQDEKGDRGNTALMKNRSNFEMIDYLLNAGADVNAVNTDGIVPRTVLDMVLESKKKDLKILKRLKKAGAKESKRMRR